MINACRTLFIALFFCLVGSSAALAQTESFDAAQFTPPKGWTKTTKPGAVIYMDSDKTTGKFCILSVYAAAASTGDPKSDFAGRWKELVVDRFKAAPTPQTETKSEDGWTAVAGGANIDSDGVKAAVIMTVYSGYGKTIPVLALLNDEAYIAAIDSFQATLKLDKTPAASPPAARRDLGSDQDYLAFDPFPDQPNYQPQKPLTGRLKKSITMADLVGRWEYGAASVESYYNSSSGNYAGTDTTFFAESYTIKPNGTFEKSFAGRSGNHTIREKDSGTVTLNGGFVILNFNGRITYKYQLIAFMVDDKGGAILSLLQVGDNEPGLNAERLRLGCGHSRGYISCVSGEEWVRRPAK